MAKKMGGRLYYVVGALKFEHPINVKDLGGKDIHLPLAWADGMIGALPVFDDYEKAKEYAGDKYKLTPLFEEDTP